jgi:hypothetical protein
MPKRKKKKPRCKSKWEVNEFTHSTSPKLSKRIIYKIK